VKLMGAAGEPHPAPRLQQRRLGQLRQPEQFAVEAPGLGLASDRRRNLDVVDSQQHGVDDRMGMVVRPASIGATFCS
jgi:hypothetical protein